MSSASECCLPRAFSSAARACPLCCVGVLLPLFDGGPSRCSPGIMLVIFNRPAASHVISLVIRSIETGEVFLIFSPNALRTIDACFTVGQFHARPTTMRAVCDVHPRWCAQILKKFSHKLKPKKIEFIEQFNEKLLIKQESESLQIVDVRQHIRCFLCVAAPGICISAAQIARALLTGARSDCHRCAPAQVLDALRVHFSVRKPGALHPTLCAPHVH